MGIVLKTLRNISFFLTLIVLLSCSKDEPVVLGCTDEVSLNYDANANKDDGSCIFPADKLIGNWNGKDEVTDFNSATLSTTTVPTVNYTAAITKSDKTIILIEGNQPSKPSYLYQGPITVLWSEMKLEVSGNSVTGTITNENSFVLNYTYGTGTHLYTVKQTYTR